MHHDGITMGRFLDCTVVGAPSAPRYSTCPVWAPRQGQLGDSEDTGADISENGKSGGTAPG